MKSTLHFHRQGKVKLSLLTATIIIASIVGIIMIILVIRFNGTGFGPYTRVSVTRTISDTLSKTEEPLQGKTLWDWMQLLIIPAMLALGVFWLDQMQKDRDRKAEEAQKKREEDAAKERESLERESREDNQRETALQTYIDRMSELLLNGHLHNRETTVESEEARNIARVRTVTVLPRLDKVRKRSVIQFLYESDLIGIDDNPECIVTLEGAELGGAQLDKVNLSSASLKGIDLSGACLRGANLRSATLSGADLTGADLSGADLSGADLSDADLSGADLSDANLNGTIITVRTRITKEQLETAKLKGSNCFQWTDDYNATCSEEE